MPSPLAWSSRICAEPSRLVIRTSAAAPRVRAWWARMNVIRCESGENVGKVVVWSSLLSTILCGLAKPGDHDIDGGQPQRRRVEFEAVAVAALGERELAAVARSHRVA